eukprot:6473122-Amphidinium_carterae.1
MELEGTLITMQLTFYVSITMSPDCVGRAELPDNLAALSRPAAMMVPDYTSFGYIIFFEFGFADARVFKFFKHRGALCDRPTTLGLAGNKADMKSYNDAATLVFQRMLVLIILNPGYASSAELSDNLACGTWHGCVPCSLGLQLHTYVPRCPLLLFRLCHCFGGCRVLLCE